MFFGSKIPLKFISMIIHVHLIKKSHNQTGNFYTRKVCNRVFNRRFNRCLYICHFLTAEISLSYESGLKKSSDKKWNIRAKAGTFVHLIPLLLWLNQCG